MKAPPFFTLTRVALAELGGATVSGDHADPEEDGVPNLLDYAHGGNPRVISESRTISISRGAGEDRGSVSVSFRRLLLAHGVDHTFQTSTEAGIGGCSRPGAVPPGGNS